MIMSRDSHKSAVGRASYSSKIWDFSDRKPDENSQLIYPQIGPKLNISTNLGKFVEILRPVLESVHEIHVFDELKALQLFFGEIKSWIIIMTRFEQRTSTGFRNCSSWGRKSRRTGAKKSRKKINFSIATKSANKKSMIELRSAQNLAENSNLFYPFW